MGTDDPKKLIFALVFYVGKHFALRGGTELHSLKFNHEIKITITDSLVYEEIRPTKVTNTGIKSKFKPIKRVEAYHSEGHERCLVCLYKLYTSKRPENCSTNALFLSWFRKTESIAAGKWYQNIPLGRHTLDGVVRNLSDSMPGSSKYTNQSLRKTCASTLHKAGVGRDDIAKITGHSSASIERYISLDSDDHMRYSSLLQSGGNVVSESVNENLPAVAQLSQVTTNCSDLIRYPATTSTMVTNAPSEGLPATTSKMVTIAPSQVVFNAPPHKKMRISANGDTNTVEIVFD